MIKIRFTADPLPSDFSGTLQDFQTRFLLNLKGTIEDNQVVAGQVGGPMPVVDVGPWHNGESWHVWNGSSYVPSIVKVGGAGYTVQLGDYTTTGTKQIVPNQKQTLQDKSGTVALLSDVNVGRPCVNLGGTTPTLDWSLGHHFAEILAGNTTITHKNSQPGQRIAVTLKNNATSYSVTWSAIPAIAWPSGSPPSQTALKTDLYIFENVAGSILGRQIPNY